eukprot:UN12680
MYFGKRKFPKVCPIDRLVPVYLQTLFKCPDLPYAELPDCADTFVTPADCSGCISLFMDNRPVQLQARVLDLVRELNEPIDR